jgi:hypothetical protein
MNWRNPFLVTYLAVTVVGTAVFGYLFYSAWTHAQEVDASYLTAVNKLHQLQNRAPFPSDENNDKYVQFTKDYRAEYDKLVAKAGGMQKPVTAIRPEDFQDLLRSNVSQVQQAAKENNVVLPEGFYLGFDQYQAALPSEAAAGPLARELAGIRLVVDQLIQMKVRQIDGIKRYPLPEEGGRQASAQQPPTGGGSSSQGAGASNRNARRQGQGQATGGSQGGRNQVARDVVVSNNFEIVFVADQAAARSALNFVANSSQFFIIRYLNIENSATEGPLRVSAEEAAAAAAATQPPADPSQPAAPAPADAPNELSVLVGLETLKVALRIEMITFNNLPAAN